MGAKAAEGPDRDGCHTKICPLPRQVPTGLTMHDTELSWERNKRRVHNTMWSRMRSVKTMGCIYAVQLCLNLF